MGHPHTGGDQRGVSQSGHDIVRGTLPLGGNEPIRDHPLYSPGGTESLPQEKSVLPQPGEYRPDSTEGITRIEDLPQPKVQRCSRNFLRRPCPRCGHSSYRGRQGHAHPPRPRQPAHRAALRHSPGLLAALLLPVPQVLQGRYDRPGRPRQSLYPTRRRRGSPPRCRGRTPLPGCQLDALAGASRLRPLRHDPEPGRGRGGEKAARRLVAAHLDWAAAGLLGLHRRGRAVRRPVTAFFRRFQAALQARGLALHGITTGGAVLYPVPIAAVFGDVPHQVCQFHILAELIPSSPTASLTSLERS